VNDVKEKKISSKRCLPLNDNENKLHRLCNVKCRHNEYQNSRKKERKKNRLEAVNAGKS
jgi:hypothetical protein